LPKRIPAIKGTRSLMNGALCSLSLKWLIGWMKYRLSYDKFRIVALSFFVDFRANFADVIFIVYDHIPASRKYFKILGRTGSF
jgi:hypothetical protein